VQLNRPCAAAMQPFYQITMNTCSIVVIMAALCHYIFAMWFLSFFFFYLFFLA